MSAINEHLKTGLTSAEPAKATQLSLAQAQNKLSAKPTNAEETLAGKDGFSFGDLIDVINPLQHIPGVSHVYRAITGDEIGAAAKVAGAALFGGPIGAGLALADAAVELATGEDTASNIADAIGNEPTPQTVASATVLTAGTAAASPTTEEIIVAAVDRAADGAVTLPKEDEEEQKRLAAEAALNASGPFRLGVDTVADKGTGKAGKAAEALAEAVKPDVDRVGITLNPDVSDVAVKALGGTSLQHQIYRQVQTVDPLYSRALDMSS